MGVDLRTENNGYSKRLVMGFLAVLSLLFFITFFISLFCTANYFNELHAENKAFISSIESDPTGLEHVGSVLSYKPILRNGTDRQKGASAIVGTKLTLENGLSIGVIFHVDHLNLPVEVRKSRYKDNNVYCLVSEKVPTAKCGFELKLSSFG